MITGKAGFIDSYLFEYLLHKGDRSFCSDNSRTRYPKGVSTLTKSILQ